MKIFETERLSIRSLENVDKKYFAELFTDPKILELIPQKVKVKSNNYSTVNSADKIIGFYFLTKAAVAKERTEVLLVVIQ